MEDILKRIEAFKRLETSEREKDVPAAMLKDNPLYNRVCISLAEKLKVMNTPQFIAEFKRQSPSKGIIRKAANPIEISKSYQDAGAAAISVLTDEKFFGALHSDFERVRKVISLPILRKDFILDEYQVHETKAMGADIILLIAAMLSPQQVSDLAGTARGIGLEVLLELHSEEELGHHCDSVSLIGVNNRNLNTFEVKVEHTLDFSLKLPKGIPAIAESGLTDPRVIARLFLSGFKGFLIGEYFMRAENPGEKCRELLNHTNKLLK